MQIEALRECFLQKKLLNLVVDFKILFFARFNDIFVFVWKLL